MGVVQIFTKRAAEGIAECERALALDRNLATAHAWIGLGKCNLGRAEETEAHIMEAFRLSPRDNKASSWMNTAGVAQSYLGADEAAVHWFKRSTETNRNIAPFVHFFLGRRWPISGASRTHGPRRWRGLPSTPISAWPNSTSVRRPTIRPASSSGSGSPMA